MLVTKHATDYLEPNPPLLRSGSSDGENGGLTAGSYC
jgi:hypothetical protein